MAKEIYRRSEDTPRTPEEEQRAQELARRNAQARRNQAAAANQPEGDQRPYYTPRQPQRPAAAPAKRRPKPTYEEWEAEQPKNAKKYRTPEQRATRGCLIAFLVGLLLVAGVIGAGYLWYQNEVDGKHASATGAVQINVPSGTRGKGMSDILEENGLIGNSLVFQVYVKLNGLAPQFQSGDFIIEPGASYDEICEIISETPNARNTFDIRLDEGVSLMQIAARFEEMEFCTAQEFLDAANNLEAYTDIPVIEALLSEEDYDPNVFYRAEGYIFPDTYQFFTDATVEEVVHQLYEELDSKFTAETYARMEEQDLSVREVVTLASLIQAEAGHVEQQPRVSRVFWNRLSGDWDLGTLGSDVTLRYIKIWMQWNMPEFADIPRSEITYDQTREAVGDELFYSYVTDDSDSNSRRGLPSGPVCSISDTALQAALYPTEDTEYADKYYFLTTKLGNYYYAATYNEHLANIETMNAENAEYDRQEAEAAEQQQQDGNSLPPSPDAIPQDDDDYGEAA